MTLEDAAAFVARVEKDDHVIGFVLTFTRHTIVPVTAYVYALTEDGRVEEYQE